MLNENNITSDNLSYKVISDNDFKRHLKHLIGLYDSADDTRKHHNQLAYLKNLFNASREHAKHILFTHKDGCKAAQYLSSFQDKFIHMLYDLACLQQRSVLKPSHAKCMIAASGGYGRGMLAPYSDIDLLIIIDTKKDVWLEAVIGRVLYWLWDLGFQLGHAVRTLSEAIDYAQTDMVIRTTILETRYICGEKKLFTDMQKMFVSHFQQTIDPDFISSKLEERAIRHARVGDSRYLVEPDIKNGKGGLRDLYSLFWIAKYVYKVKNRVDLIQVDILNNREWTLFNKCERFLWTVRLHLHFISGKPTEKISFDVQTILTEKLAYKSRKGLRDVERFMKHYFFYAKHVGDLTRILCSALEKNSVQTKFQTQYSTHDKPSSYDLEGENDFYVYDHYLHAKHNYIFYQNPVNFVKLFYITSSSQIPIHPTTLHLAMRNRYLVNSKLYNNMLANTLFLEILTVFPNPETSLRRMHEAGILSKIIPEFQHILCLMQFNMYHHYTVDEHSLRAVGILSALEKGEYKEESPTTSALIHSVRLRRALYLAVLLHDIAKGYPEDHSVKGAEIASQICSRLPLDEEEKDMVSWLILHHLLMNNYAQRRDLNDPKTIKDFTDIVNSQEKLDLLIILTVCDIRAVGPGVWNGWKGALLRDLYYAARDFLAGKTYSHGIKHIKESKTKLITQQDHKEENLHHKYINLFPDNYFISVSQEQFDTHIKLLHTHLFNADEPKFEIKTDSFKDISKITILIPISAKLLLILASCCAYRKHNIVDAELFVLKNGVALATLYLKKRYTDYQTEIRNLKRLTRNIDDSLKGKMMILDKIREHKPNLPKTRKTFAFAPQIHFYNDWSDRFSVVEITCLDTIGLLSIITHAFFCLNLEIHSAKIMTLGERVIDTFYIHDLVRQKIYDKKRITDIHNHLLKVITDNQL